MEPVVANIVLSFPSNNSESRDNDEEAIIPHIIKVNDQISKTLQDGDFTLAIEIIETARDNNIKTVIFEEIDKEEVIGSERLNAFVDEFKDMDIWFQGNHLGPKTNPAEVLASKKEEPPAKEL